MKNFLKNNLIKNYLYSLGFTIYNMLVPMIILPYISRVLGNKNIGLNTFVYSINQYFILLANLGLILYGSREIAFVKQDSKKLNETIIDLFIIKLTSSIVTLILYIFFIQFQEENLKKYMYLYSLGIISVIFDVTWIFQGLENFKTLVIRNFLVKTLSIILILVNVRHTNDLEKYIIIVSLSTLISNLIILKSIFKLVNLKKYQYNWNRLKQHFLANNKLFILQVAIQLYSYIDKIMLGYFGRIIEAGYYDIAQQITRIGITLNSTLTNIMIPRVTKLFSENKIEEIKKIITKSLIFSLSLSFPIIFGLLAIKNEIIIIFFGDEYIAVSQILTFILPIIFIVPIGNVLGIQLMIPLKKEKIVTIIPVIGLLISIVLNFILIPKIGIKGSIIASLSVESIGSFLSWYFTKHWIDIACILKKSIKSLIAAILMYIILSNVEVFTKEYLFFKIILGILLYGISFILFEYKYILKLLKNNKV